jgi:flagellar basal body-associated protein FliL
MSEQEQPQPEAAPKKKKGKLPLFIILFLVIAGSGGVVGKIFLGGKDAKKSEKLSEEVGAKMTLEEFLVNLAGGGEHYLKATLALGLAKGESEEKLKEELAPIRDAILSALSSKDLKDVSSESGKDKLKMEIVDKVNKELRTKKVLKVYFLTFATQ